jgi:hypothetical protein
MIKNIHFITYANGTHRNTNITYSSTQQLLTNTIQNNTKYNVIFHTHNLETIMQKEWFVEIAEFPNVSLNQNWNRGGYYNSWKPFLVKEVYDMMGDDDLLYYVDSSGYHQCGFEHNIDTLMEYTHLNKNVCGSFGSDVLNNSFNCCDNIEIWNFLNFFDKDEINKIMNIPHVLNSWFVFSKDSINSNFINEWVFLLKQKLNNIPIVAYHHTVDQSLFNILVCKYKFNSFYNNRPHNDNKNHNLVHFELNSKSNDEIENFFINPINFNLC